MPKAKVRSGARVEGSATGAVLEFLRAREGSIVTARAVADSLGLDRKVTATLLSRMAREGKIAKLARGRYSVSKRSIKASGQQTVQKARAVLPSGEHLWKRIFDGLSAEVVRSLGPMALRKLEPDTAKGHRERVEMLVAQLRDELGGRMALDMVQPVFEDVFGGNGKAAAFRLCMQGRA